MGDVYVIVGMDWLSRFRAVIDCQRQLVVVRTLREVELTIYGEGIRVSSTFCLASKAS